MKYYSTNKQAPIASLEKAVVKGLAEDKGLYMPEKLRSSRRSFSITSTRCHFRRLPALLQRHSLVRT